MLACKLSADGKKADVVFDTDTRDIVAKDIPLVNGKIPREVKVKFKGATPLGKFPA